MKVAQSSVSSGGLAVVLGAGFAGMLAARVLSEHYRQVVVLERSGSPELRFDRDLRSVPQTPHAHHMLYEGKRIIDKLFPSFQDAFVRNGGKVVDFGSDFRFFLAGTWRPSAPLGVPMYLSERVVLEKTLHECVSQIGNVKFLWGQAQETGDDQSHENFRQKLGMIIAPWGKLDFETPIFDCTGRQRAVKETLRYATTNIWYTSFFLERPRKANEAWSVQIGYNKRPECRVACYSGYTPRGYNVLQFTVMSYGVRPPRSAGLLMDWLRQHGPSQEFTDLLESVDPHVKGCQMAFPDMFICKPSRVAERLVSIGDSACVLDPVTGVGITKAAVEVEILDQILRRGAGRKDWKLEFEMRAMKIRKRAWLGLREQNIRFEPGWNPYRLLHWYIDLFVSEAMKEPKLFRVFVDIRNLRYSLFRVLASDIVFLIVRSALAGVMRNFVSDLRALMSPDMLARSREARGNGPVDLLPAARGSQVKD